jgi:hypothetical protein
MRTTGIGSLPFTSVDEALALSLAHDLPFMPELPALDSNEFLLGARPDAAVVSRFVQRVERGREVKVQLVGPTTLGSVEACVQRMRSMLLVLGTRPVLFTLDEPSLKTPTVDHVVLLDVLREAGVRTALHCCGQPDWSAVLRLPVDVVFFDARLSLNEVVACDAWPTFVERGGAIGLGLLATSPPADDLTQRCKVVLERLRDTTPALDALLRRSYVTPACGLALQATVHDVLPQLRRARALLLNEGCSTDAAPVR